MGGGQRTSGRAARITVLLAAVMVALLVFLIVTAPLTGTVTLGKVWAALSLLTIVMVTGVVGVNSCLNAMMLSVVSKTITEIMATPYNTYGWRLGRGMNTACQPAIRTLTALP